MKKRKEIFRIVSIFASFIFFFLLSTTNVDAIYNVELNKVTGYKVDKNNDVVTVSFQYQYGIKDIQVFICDAGTGSQNCAPTAAGGTPTYDAQRAIKSIFIDEGSKAGYVNSYNDLTSASYNYYTPLSGGLALSEYTDKYDDKGKIDNTYRIAVKASFCTTRNAVKDTCLSWSKHSIVLLDEFNIHTGLTNSPVLNNTISRVLNITHSIVIPVLWLLLGALLIIRGVILAVQIVKSSDEPEVRKAKINGVIWLVAGVAIGYAVTISARVVMEMFGYGGYF